MPALLNTESMLLCPHGGSVQIISANTQTQVGGAYAALSSDTFVIGGCPFVIGVVPSPCVQVQWVEPAVRSQVGGNFTLTEASVGLCVAATGAVQGTVLVAEAQPQVSGL
jgi:hypothetical protein